MLLRWFHLVGQGETDKIFTKSHLFIGVDTGQSIIHELIIEFYCDYNVQESKKTGKNKAETTNYFLKYLVSSVHSYK